MTFFFALILLPPEASQYEPERMFEVIDRLIQPADQSFPNQPYLIPCRCISYEAQRYGIQEANRQIGSICTMGHAYIVLPPSNRPAWSEFPPVIQWQAIAEQTAKLHPNYASPKPNCEDCQGSGQMEAMENHSGFVGYDYWANPDILELYLGSSMVSWVRDLSEQLEVEALITPNGAWHEIDWWNQSREEWQEQVRQRLQYYLDHLAVKLYMHA